jgi:hypothetical protein
MLSVTYRFVINLQSNNIPLDYMKLQLRIQNLQPPLLEPQSRQIIFSFSVELLIAELLCYLSYCYYTVCLSM